MANKRDWVGSYKRPAFVTRLLKTPHDFERISEILYGTRGIEGDS